MTTQRPRQSFLCLFCAAATTASSLHAPEHSTAGRRLQNPQHQNGRTQCQHVLSCGRARTSLSKPNPPLGHYGAMGLLELLAPTLHTQPMAAAGPAGAALGSCSR